MSTPLSPSEFEKTITPLSFENIKDIVAEFLEQMDFTYSSLKVSETGKRIWIEIKPREEERSSLYIGYRGQNIAALQYLIIQILWNKGLPHDAFVVVDIDGYRKKNEEKVIDIVLSKIQQLEETDTPQTMPFLDPQERRMVHLYIINNYPFLQTESFTDERKKRVLKILKRETV